MGCTTAGAFLVLFGSFLLKLPDEAPAGVLAGTAPCT